MGLVVGVGAVLRFCRMISEISRSYRLDEPGLVPERTALGIEAREVRDVLLSLDGGFFAFLEPGLVLEPIRRSDGCPDPEYNDYCSFMTLYAVGSVLSIDNARWRLDGRCDYSGYC